MIKESTYQKDITVTNMYAFNKVPTYIKQKLIEQKGDIQDSTIVGEFILILNKRTIRKSTRK